MHINDFENMSDVSKLSIDELKKIEGTDDIVYGLNKMDEFIKEFDKVPSLAKNFNWYIEPSIKLRVLKKLFKVDNDERKVDEILINYYKENLDRIYNDFIKYFPNREKIFDEMFHAHNNGLYYSSCLLFMTQIDGVIHDLFSGKNYFHGAFFKEKIESLKNLDNLTVGDIFLKQLFNKELPIRLHSSNRNAEFNHLNRHQIIHGEITDYNTEINSLKSLSLLATLAFNLKYLKEKT